MIKVISIGGKKTTTLIDKSVKELRTAIMQGELRPGQKLVEGDLCERLGISRASLREALRALEADRLINLVPNRGPSVAKLGSREIEEIQQVWALMTGEMVYRFAKLAKLKEIQELEVVFSHLKTALRKKDTLLQLSATTAFFNYISSRCGNGILAEMVRTLVSRMHFLRTQSLSLDGWRLLCAEEISNILTAIRLNRPSDARRAARVHISSACEAAKQVTRLMTDRHPQRRSKQAAARTETAMLSFSPRDVA